MFWQMNRLATALDLFILNISLPFSVFCSMARVQPFDCAISVCMFHNNSYWNWKREEKILKERYNRDNEWKRLIQIQTDRKSKNEMKK